MAHVLAAVLGTALVLGTISSAVKTVILPRSAQSLITRAVFRAVQVPFRILAHERRSYAARDRVMAFFAPFGLIVLAAVWMVAVLAGFTAIYWSIGAGSWAESFNLSGSSITTLGFATASSTGTRALEFTEAGLGLFLVALIITYLPTMYSAFSRRERQVALLEVRAGSPPSAVEMLERLHNIGWLDKVGDTFLEWEGWFAEIEEAHTSYAALNFFRSPQPERSWVTAAGTVLDAGSLWMAAIDHGQGQGPAGVMVRSGYIALRRIADFFAIQHDPDPSPTDPISITRPEFDDACDRLAAAGIAMVADREQAWRDFAGWRVNYDTVLLALAEITMAPYAPWTSDRSAPSHRRPRIRGFGRASRTADKDGDIPVG